MEVDCAECAGCCLDWRPLGRTDDSPATDSRSIDDWVNFVTLSRDDISALLAAGYGDVFRPRLWYADEADAGATVDAIDIATIAGNPVFSVGLRQVWKPVGPFGQVPSQLETCVFLDPMTLQCRIHTTDHYPTTCSTYPGQHLLMDVETECERVESHWAIPRLLEDSLPEDLHAPPLGPQSLGSTVFVHPEPDDLSGSIDRLRRDQLTRDDRIEFAAIALAQSPGMPQIDRTKYATARERLESAISWVTESRERLVQESNPTPAAVSICESNRGAPKTDGWSE